MDKVLVGLSGGVDSSVTAHILREKGYHVVGLHLIIWKDETDRVAEIADRLGIEFQTADVRDEFRNVVIRYFVESYRKGLTPNPCALCNREIKLRFMLEAADRLGIKWVATGHYLRVIDGMIYRGIDKSKDQSYFLALVPAAMVERLITPLGGLTKAEVVEMARKLGISRFVSSESQDVCFLQGTDLVSFLKEHIGDLPGEIVGPDGRVIGTHPGTHYFTVGQRKGLGVAVGERVYVRAIDPLARRVFLGYTARFKFMEVGELNWFERPNSPFRAFIKIRQLHRPAPGRVEVKGDRAVVEFDEPQWAPTPGQIAAFYVGDKLIGGGVIESYR